MSDLEQQNSPVKPPEKRELSIEEKLAPAEASPSEKHETSANTPSVATPNYLRGWRLHTLTLALCLSLFLVNLEVTIISTSLIAITDDLRGFKQSGWLITGYLITYTGFIIIWAKLSDIFGRKLSINSTILLFVAFSAGCAASQTMTQLITNRVFQGIGGAGCYSLAVVVLFEMVPSSKYAAYGGLMSACVALATVTGPLFGGAISQNTTWRWIFLLNIPVGIATMILLIITIPHNFPHQGQPDYVPLTIKQIFSKGSLRRVDFLGAFLLLTGSLLLVTALLEAGIDFPWSSAAIIILLVISALVLAAFLVCEYFVTKASSHQEPVFPWRFMHNRAWMAMLVTAFLVGIPFNVVIIDLPQRFQAVSSVSPLGAGIRLIPYSFATPLGSLLANVVASKRKVQPIFLLLFGASLQLIGLALMTTLSNSGGIPAAQYGYEILTGFGVGTMFGILLLLTPFAVDRRDLAVATGATIQFRMLGGAIGLAIADSIMNNYLTTNLSHILTPTQLESLLQSTNTLATFPNQLRATVGDVFVEGYNLQMKVITGLAAAQFLTIAAMWRRKGGQIVPR